MNQLEISVLKVVCERSVRGMCCTLDCIVDAAVLERTIAIGVIGSLVDKGLVKVDDQQNVRVSA